MTWETVVQALVLTAGATGASWWLGREPRPRREPKPFSPARQELKVLADNKRDLLERHAELVASNCPALARDVWAGAERVQRRIGELESRLDPFAVPPRPVRAATGEEVQRVLREGRSVASGIVFCDDCNRDFGHPGPCAT